MSISFYICRSLCQLFNHYVGSGKTNDLLPFTLYQWYDKRCIRETKVKSFSVTPTTLNTTKQQQNFYFVCYIFTKMEKFFIYLTTFRNMKFFLFFDFLFLVFHILSYLFTYIWNLTKRIMFHFFFSNFFFALDVMDSYSYPKIESLQS